MKISPEVLDRITALRHKRDHAAFCLGAARHEYLTLEQRHLTDIARWGQDEKAIGEVGLRELGLTPETEELAISADGIVLRFIDGVWAPVGD